MLPWEWLTSINRSYYKTYNGIIITLINVALEILTKSLKLSNRNDQGYQYPSRYFINEHIFLRWDNAVRYCPKEIQGINEIIEV